MYDALFFKKYHDWKRIRAILSPSFTVQKLKVMKPIIDEKVESLINKFSAISKEGKPADLRQYFDAFSHDVIAQTSFGIKIDSFEEPNNPIIRASKEFFQNDPRIDQLLAFFFPILRKIFKWTVLDLESQIYLGNMIKQVIRKRVQNWNTNNADLLQLTINSSELAHTIPGSANKSEGHSFSSK